MEPISALIGAGSSLLGGLLGQSNASKIAEQQSQQAELNRQMQLKFAQNAIQWKVADAKEAGIHPLYALGASTSSYSPVSIGSTADNSLGEGIAKAGQDISRAVSATADRELRALQLQKMTLDVEGQSIANDVARAELASKLARVAQPGSPPAYPVVAPGPVKLKPEEQTQSFRILGKTLLNDPFTSDVGDAISNVLGDDAGEFVMAVPKGTSTVFYNGLRNILYRYDRATGEQFDRWMKLNYPAKAVSK